MQLFTIGVHKLNMDGTLELDSSGLPIAAYDNTDIQNFARAWTGFTRQEKRSNIESHRWDYNRMDPLRIEGQWRDASPKMDLDGSYIGDKVPLCVDRPEKQFLRKGATYRLVGSSYQPMFHSPQWSSVDQDKVKILSLSTSSGLYSKLCNGSPGSCNFQTVVTIDTNLGCVGIECSVDDLRLVQVQSNPPINYEYVRPPCEYKI